MNKKTLLTSVMVAIVFVAVGIGISQYTLLDMTQCKTTNEQEIAALFDRWNGTLKTEDPAQVVKHYASDALLLPTLSDKARLTVDEKKDYFAHFLAKKPVGAINLRVINIGCNSAVDSGHYTFTLDGREQLTARYTFTYQWHAGQWLISSHHSSRVPKE